MRLVKYAPTVALGWLLAELWPEMHWGERGFLAVMLVALGVLWLLWVELSTCKKGQRCRSCVRAGREHL